MAKKTNIRSIRFSDDVAELIDQQAGRTFTEKFDFLLTRCFFELPEKQRQLARLDQQINDKRKQLLDLSARLSKLSTSVRVLESVIERELDKLSDI